MVMDLFRERRHLRSSWWRFSHLCTCFSGLLRASAGLRSCGFCRGFVIGLDAGRYLVCFACASEEVVTITLPTKSLCRCNTFAFGSHLKLQVANENKMFSRSVTTRWSELILEPKLLQAGRQREQNVQQNVWEQEKTEREPFARTKKLSPEMCVNKNPYGYFSKTKKTIRKRQKHERKQLHEKTFENCIFLARLKKK